MMTIFHRPSSIRNAVSIPAAAINGVRRVADRSHGYFRVRDHAWMIAAGNVVDPRLGTRRKLELDVGRNDLVGVPYDVPGENRLPSTASGALSVKQRAANGRCVAANRAATFAGSADANTVPKYLELTYRSSAVGCRESTHRESTAAAERSRVLTERFPASGANASTNTNAFRSGVGGSKAIHRAAV
jgi:hypothetical protein